MPNWTNFSHFFDELNNYGTNKTMSHKTICTNFCLNTKQLHQLLRRNEPAIKPATDTLAHNLYLTDRDDADSLNKVITVHASLSIVPPTSEETEMVACSSMNVSETLMTNHQAFHCTTICWQMQPKSCRKITRMMTTTNIMQRSDRISKERGRLQGTSELKDLLSPCVPLIPLSHLNNGEDR